MLLARRSIVLEEMGLLAGLEWLAERTEDRSDVRVEILVEGGPRVGAAGAGAGPARPPRDVERAAFRVAQLALDNVVRHAPGASVAGPRRRRPEPRPPARSRTTATGRRSTRRPRARSGRRGLADMRAEAGRLRRRARGRARRGRPRHGDRLPLAGLTRPGQRLL